jgi:hypothetical protein
MIVKIAIIDFVPFPAKTVAEAHCQNSLGISPRRFRKNPREL